MVKSVMSGKLKLKGHLKHLARWPLYLSVLLIVLNILVYVINRRSFGWTLQLSIQPVVFLQALGIALLAALLAGILPARRLGRMAAAEAIRYE